jgi:hypothetical protein
MISGHYPFLADTLQETYNKVKMWKQKVHLVLLLPYCTNSHESLLPNRLWTILFKYLTTRTPNLWICSKSFSAKVILFIFQKKKCFAPVLQNRNNSVRCGVLTCLLCRSRRSYNPAGCGWTPLGCWGQGASPWVHVQMWLWPQEGEWFSGRSTITEHDQNSNGLM